MDSSEDSCVVSFEAPDPSRRPSPTTAALLAWASSLAVIVAADGTVVGRLLRAVAVILVAAGVAVLDHRRRRLGGVAFLLLAVVGIDVGATFGARHLADDGVSLVSLAGVVCLVAGLVLAVAGGRRLVAGSGRWQLLSVPALVLVTALAVWTTVPAVLATNVPPIERGSAEPADHGLDASEVRFDAVDGTGLAGWYVPSTNGAAVLVRHGAGSSAASNLAQAAAIAAHGYGVLLVDARGHGRSEGRAMDFGWFGDDDVVGAVTFLSDRPDVDPDRIGVVGFSMGGEEAIGAMAADPRIRTVVAEGATGRTDADLVWLDDVYGWRGDVQQGLSWVTFTLTDLLTDAPKPTPLADAIAEAAPRRILLVTAGDVPDEGHAAAHVRATAPERVEVHEVPGADHTGGFAVDPQSWERLVVDWLDAELASVAAAK